MYRKFWLLSLALVLAACQGISFGNPTPTATITPIPTATLTLTPLPTPTATPFPEEFTSEVRVGDYPMKITCKGTGEPTIILENGMDYPSWSSPRFSKISRTCIYPRVGMGLDPAKGRDGFALAWEGLRLAAAQVTAAEADDEYHRLFIGLGRGELVPYGSWYQTGFLMELPLGALRRDLAALGFERAPGVHEPEDHVAALCEVMAQLALDPDIPVERQRGFFRAHIGPWIRRFCRDLDAVPAAPLYGAVGRLAAAFFEIEGRYLEIQG